MSIFRFRSGLACIAAATLAVAPAPAQVRAITPAEKAQGATAHPQLLQQYGGAWTGPQAAFVARVGKRVALQSGLGDSAADFVVTTLDSPVENAFAIPGGYIYVTRQLLALMTSEAELASVLGHEVGHVAARHAQSRNTRATIGSILAAGAGALTGNELIGRAIGTGANLYTLHYGRDQEYQADALGIRYITAAGYDPRAAPAILDALDESTALAAQAGGGGGRLPTWASTHPNGADRVRRATRLAEETGRPPAAGQDTAFLRMLDGLRYGPADARRVIRVVTAGPRDTVDSLAQRMADADRRRERFLLLNGLADDQAVAPGRLYKLVVAG